jgi:hypothetical protein
MQKPRLVEWMAWRRYLIATRASSSAPYHVREEAAWARLLDDLAGVGVPGSRLGLSSSNERIPALQQSSAGSGG